MKYIQILNSGLLVAALMAAGCNKANDGKPAAKAPDTGAKEGTAEHAPHGAGPNGGVVFDVGKHHGEFTVDHPKQQCMVLILGDDEKTPLAVAATELTLAINETKTKEGKVVEAMTITLSPVDAVDGKASKFVGTDPGIGNIADFDGTVFGEIDGKPAQGAFKE